MMRTVLLVIVTVHSCLLSFGQSINGRITSSESKNPVPYANVFLSGTLVGTTSDLEGIYALELKSQGRFQLVVSCVGFEDFIEEIEFAGTDLTLDVSLSTSIKELSEVYVNPDTSNRRLNLEAFNGLFLGGTKNAQKAAVLNLEDVFVFFDEEEKALYAHSQNELIIRNEALGYDVVYRLKEFQMDYEKGQFRSLGIPRFMEHQKKGNRQSRKQIRERERAYLGSFSHLLNALARDSHPEEGFLMQELFKVPNKARPAQHIIDQNLQRLKASVFAGGGLFLGSGEVDTTEIVVTKNNLSEYRKKGMIRPAFDSLIVAKIEEVGYHKMKVLKRSSESKSTHYDSLRFWAEKDRLPALLDSIGRTHKRKTELIDTEGNFQYIGLLRVTYKDEVEEANYAKLTGKIKPDKKQVSELKVLKPFKVYENGFFDADAVLFYGYMGWSQRIAELLPLGYKP